MRRLKRRQSSRRDFGNLGCRETDKRGTKDDIRVTSRAPADRARSPVERVARARCRGAVGRTVSTQVSARWRLAVGGTVEDRMKSRVCGLRLGCPT